MGGGNTVTFSNFRVITDATEDAVKGGDKRGAVGHWGGPCAVNEVPHDTGHCRHA